MACTTDIEAALWKSGYKHIAGIDEAGRGALAGPVVAAAVILPQGTAIPGVDDSKKLRPTLRRQLYKEICARAIAVSICQRSPAQIDRVNILQATLQAMYEAATTLHVPPNYVLIDGNRAFTDSPWPVRTEKGGDARCLSIAAASILAKVFRDSIMADLHADYPEYCWNTNVGYPTRAHRAALETHGPTRHHRKSFRLHSRSR